MRPEKQTRPAILVTNDDGIASPGLHALWQALLPLGDVVVVAPERNWSAGGHSRTLTNLLRLDPYQTETTPAPQMIFTSNGTPADCVALVMLGALDGWRPTMVVSGINRGPNLGHDITYSGTVAAALEAAIWALPAIALSLDRAEGVAEDFTVAAQTAARLVPLLVEHVESNPMQGSHDAFVLNVNAPAIPPQDVKGMRFTRLGRRVYRDALVRRVDPRGRPYFWLGGPAPSGDVNLVGTDIWAIHHGYVSVTPIKLEMTDETLLDRLAAWDLK